jgi:capsular polysaccharide biosynthesis protein
MPTNAEASPAERARLTGRQLAEHPLLASRVDDDRPGVAEVLTDARPLLSTYGVTFDILRARPGMVVLRAKSDGRVSTQVACELVKGLLGAVPEQVSGVKASVVENTCAQRGAAACLFSMVWGDHESSPRMPAPPSPETLIDPPGPDAMFDEAVGPLSDASYRNWDRPIETMPPSPPVDVARAVDRTEPAPWPSPPRPSQESFAPPTAASATAYQFQVSTPNAIVLPAPPRPVVAQPAQPPVPPETEPVHAAATTQAADVVVTNAVVTGRRRFPKGLVRRSWLLALALVAGSAGGWFAGVHAGTTYGAQATLVVQSGAGKTGPGSANDALALATTYSALITKDQSILSNAGAVLHLSSSAVGQDLSVTVESGTSLLLLDFSAPTAAQAVAGADAVARAVASTTPLTDAIAAGSVAIVNVPNSAHKQGTLHKYGIELGGFLGLVVGLILVLAAERADPRIDDATSMAAAAGCRAAVIPNDLSFAELARALADAGTGKGLTVVPIAISDTAPTMELARGLRPCWPVNGPAVAISPSFSSGVVELSRGTGPTVLVSHPGTRQRDVRVAAERLRMIGRTPVWAVLANRRMRSRVSDRVG